MAEHDVHFYRWDGDYGSSVARIDSHDEDEAVFYAVNNQSNIVFEATEREVPWGIGWCEIEWSPVSQFLLECPRCGVSVANKFTHIRWHLDNFGEVNRVIGVEKVHGYIKGGGVQPL